jgi:hypothetical protein
VSKSTLNETIVNVIETELASLFPSSSAQTVEQLNESFLKENSNSYECLIEVAKVVYDLNPSTNQKKALDLILSNMEIKKSADVTFNLKVFIFTVILIKIIF